MNMVKITSALLILLSTAVFAQDEGESEASDAAAYEAPAEQEAPAAEPEPAPAKEEKKGPVSVGAKEDRPIGVRLGFSYCGVGGEKGYGSMAICWLGGAYYDVVRILDMQLGGDAFQFRMLFEPGVFVTTRPSFIEGTQVWVEVPVTAAFTLSLFGNMRMKYAVGPYVAIGTIGTFSKEISTSGVEIEVSQSRFDLGLINTFGFEQKSFKNWWADVSMAFGFLETGEVKTTVAGVETKVSDSKSVPFAFKFLLGYNF